LLSVIVTLADRLSKYSRGLHQKLFRYLFNRNGQAYKAHLECGGEFAFFLSESFRAKIYMNTDLAQLIAVFVQATLYGVYLVTYCFCVHRYLRNGAGAGWRPLRKVDWPIFVVASTLWLLSTANLTIGMVRLAESLIMKPDISTMWTGLAKVFHLTHDSKTVAERLAVDLDLPPHSRGRLDDGKSTGRQFVKPLLTFEFRCGGFGLYTKDLWWQHPYLLFYGCYAWGQQYGRSTFRSYITPRAFVSFPTYSRL
jgi:hypothetical protein